MPRIIICCSLLLIIISQNLEYIYFLLCILIFGTGLNKLTKKFFQLTNILPSNTGKRPSGCGGPKIKGLCRGCGIDDDYKDSIGSTSYGFPSGHSHSAALASTFWIIYIIKSHKDLNIQNYISIILLLIITLAVIIQRLKCKCHNIYQVISGFIYGLLCGILSYYICNKLAPDTYPM